MTVAGSLLLVAALARAGQVVPPSDQSPDWPMVGHDARHSGVNPAMPGTFAPPLFPRWIISTTGLGRPGQPQGANFLGSPIIKDGELYLALDRGETLLRIGAPTGALEAKFSHPPQHTWGGPPIGLGVPLVFSDKVFWGLVGDQVGVSAVPAMFTEDSPASFLNAGPIGVGAVRGGLTQEFGIIFAGDTVGHFFRMDASGTVARTDAVFAGANSGVAVMTQCCAETVAVPLTSGQVKFYYALANGGRQLGIGVTGDAIMGTPSADPPSEANPKVYVPALGERLLYAFESRSGGIAWVEAGDAFTSAGDMPCTPPGQVIWNTGHSIVSLNPANGDTHWETPINLGSSSLAVGNGFVFGAGLDQLVVLRLGDGHIVQQSTVAGAAMGGAPALVPDEGGLLVVRYNTRNVIAFSQTAKPFPVNDLDVRPQDLALLLVWANSPPLPPPPEQPPLKAYVISRQCAQGPEVSPPAEQVAQWAVFDTNNGTVDEPLPAPGVRPAADGLPAGKAVIRLPDNRVNPPAQDIITVPYGASPAQFLDQGLGSNDACSYQIMVVDAAGGTSNISQPTERKTPLVRPSAAPGPVGPGADWLEEEFDSHHTGWNPGERLSWSPFVAGHSPLEAEQVFQPVFTFSTTIPGTIFTKPVVSQGRLYAGASDGRLYCLNARTGALIWYLGTRGPIRFPPNVLQSRTPFQTATGAASTVITRETVTVASDDGHLYTVDVVPGEPGYRSVTKKPLGGVPVCTPEGPIVIVRRPDGRLQIDGTPVADPDGLAARAFIGPDESMIFESGAGAGHVIVFGKIYPYPENGLGLNVHGVRPSQSPYRTGYEQLVARFNDGWYGLIDDDSRPSNQHWVHLAESTGGSPTNGGLVAPFGYDPIFPTSVVAGTNSSGTPFLVPAADISFSAVEAEGISGPFRIKTISQDGTIEDRPGCSGPGIAELAALDVVVPFRPFTFTDPQTGSVGTASLSSSAAINAAISQRFPPSPALPPQGASVTQQDQSGGADYAAGQAAANGASSTNIASSAGQVGGLDLTALNGFCSFGANSPTKIGTGFTNRFGQFQAKDVTSYSGAVYSRGFRYISGTQIVGSSWAAPLALRASSITSILAPGSGPMGTVHLVWAPPPGPTADGYVVYHGLLKADPPGSATVVIDFARADAVLGEDTLAWTDPTAWDPADLGHLRYFIRPWKGSGAPPVSETDPRLGPASIVTRAESGQINTAEALALPDRIFEDEAMLITMRTSFTYTTSGLDSLKITSTFNANVASGSDLAAGSSLSPDANVSYSVSSTTGGSPPPPPNSPPPIVTTVNRPIPGVPVEIFLESPQAKGRVKLTLTEEGTEDFHQTLVTDPEGKVAFYFVPYLNSADSGMYSVHFSGNVQGAYTTRGNMTFRNQDAFVLPRTADAISTAWRYPCGNVPSDMIGIGAFASQGGGALTDASLFGTTDGVPGAYDAALELARFYGSPLASCQGVACSLPVNTRTGAMQVEIADLVLPGRGLNLAWNRTYSNFRPQFEPNGVGWVGTYFMSVEHRPDGAIVFHRASGDSTRYPRNPDQTLASPPGALGTVEEHADGSVTIHALEGQRLEFDPQGRLTQIVDRQNNRQLLTYTNGRLAKIADESGQFLLVSWDSRGRVAKVQDSAGRSVSYFYDRDDNLTTVLRPGSERTTYAYANHLLTSWHDPKLPAGAKRGQADYDELGRIVKVYDGEGRTKHTLAYELHDDGTQRTIISETCCGPRIDEYDVRGLLTAQVDAKGHRTEMEFDAGRRLVRKTDRNGHTTRLEWNDQGRLTKATDAMGNETRYEYEPSFGFMTACVDPLNRRTEFRYSAGGDLLETVDAAGGRWQNSYDGAGQLRSRTDANGHAKGVEYDLVGNAITRADALNRLTRYAWDARHRLTARTDAKQRVTTYQYDDRDLRVQTTYADGAQTRSVFDDDHRLVESTDALNRTTKTEYEKTDRVLAVTDPAGGVTRYRYDVQGNLLSVTDANGHETLYKYDALNRLVKITDPVGKTQQFAYDPEGNRTERTDGNGVHTTFTFDALNRLVSRNLPNNQTEEFVFDAAGELTRATNSSADIRYTYDVRGRVIEHRYANLGKTFTHEWDAVGNRTALHYPDGSVMRYAYSDADEQIQAVDSSAGTFTLTYDETGMRTLLAYPNGLTTSYSYDRRDRVLSMITRGEKGSGPGAQAPDFTWTHDLAGNRVTMDRSDEGLTSYFYDSKDQLIRADFPTKGTYQAFTYDPVGNRLKLQEVEHDSQLHTTDYTYDPADELLSLTQDFQDPSPSIASSLMAGPGAPRTSWTTAFSYDGNGAREAKTPDVGLPTSYNWDAQERLLQVAEGTRSLEANTYDSFARRSSITANGVTTQILCDASRSTNAAIFEYPASSKAQATRRLWVGGELRGSVEGKSPEFYLEDAIGSVVARAGGQPVISGRTFYLPFGEARSQGTAQVTSNEPDYVGGLTVRLDGATGLVYMWNRFYQSGVGAMISVDPMRRTSARANTRFPSYKYVRNSPLIHVDVNGMDDCLAVFANCMAEGLNPLSPSPTPLTAGEAAANCVAGTVIAPSLALVGAYLFIEAGCLAAEARCLDLIK